MDRLSFGRPQSGRGRALRALTPPTDLNERDAFVRSTVLGAAAVAAAAIVGLGVWGRWDWAAGFAVGALVSLGNFHLIARAVGGAAEAEAGRAVNALWKGALFRFGLTGVALVVALLVFRVSLLALVAGLLITQLTMIALWLVRTMRSLT